jgi:hypothetical protein
MSRLWIAVGIVCGLALTPAEVDAQESARVVKMTVSLPPRSAKAMPYPLLPHLLDLKQANAAMFYERSQAIQWWGPHRRKQVDAAIAALYEPWDPKTGRRDWLDEFGPLKEIDYAARCSACDWQIIGRLRSEGVQFQFPDMYAMRTLLALNSARVRAHIHEREFDKAARGLQTSFAMSRHVSEAPMWIGALVGTALAAQSQDRIEEWIQEPGAPGLFWSLTDLPSPFVDWRRPLQGESIHYDEIFPEIRQALREGKLRPISTEPINKRLMDTGFGQASPAEWALMIFEAAGPARAFFARKGFAAEEIDRLPTTQLVLMYVLSRCDEHSEAYIRLQNIPYWQARPFLKKLAAQRIEQRKELALLAVADAWIPHFEFVFQSRALLERRFALLRTIEALRLHAGEHDGQWPDTLDDLRPLPLSADPFTGKAFAYRREGNTAILEAGAPPGHLPNHGNAIRCELTLRN